MSLLQLQRLPWRAMSRFNPIRHCSSKDLTPSVPPPKSLSRPPPAPGTDVTFTPISYTLSVPDPTKQTLQKTLYQKPYESTYKANRPLENPLARAFDIMKLPRHRKTTFYKKDFDAYYDVAIIGGGIMGLSTAYWLAERMHGKIKVCVIERDQGYRRSGTTMSLGCLRQQYSTPENLEMSLFGADFFRNAHKLLHVCDWDIPDIHYQPHGCLMLANEEQAEQMQIDYQMHTAMGAKIRLLNPKKVKEKFPWINTDGVALASLGYESEGFFDPWALINAFRMKCIDSGVHFVPGDVYNVAHRINTDKIYSDEDEDEDELRRKDNRVEEVHCYLDDGDVWPIFSSQFLITAGAESGHIAHLASIGSGNGMLRVPLPVEPRKRFNYYVQNDNGPGLNCPLVVDPSGAYFRREGYGGLYVCGRPPGCDEEEPSIMNSEVDFDWFENKIWPEMAHRVPAFKNLEMHHATANFHDYNYWDGNPVIGPHPFHTNVFFATGLSGMGIQQAPAIGRALMEILLDGKYETINLDKFGFRRFLADEELPRESKTMG